MSFSLRRQFTKPFKKKLWCEQFGTTSCAPFLDPYGNQITFASATIDHIIPIKFFNTHLVAKTNSFAFFDRYKCAANCRENLQFLDRKTNLVLGSKVSGKLNRHKKSHVSLLIHLNRKYSLELPRIAFLEAPKKK